MRRISILFITLLSALIGALNGHAQPAAAPKKTVMQESKKNNPVYDRNDNDKVSLSDAEWKKVLPEEVYYIARMKGTERPWTSKFEKMKDIGTYYCAACGNALFRSDTKFESGCGWPSFTRPIDAAHVNELVDHSHGMIRTEVRSTAGDSHLGHVFDDGPNPTGLRYCINSASLRFVPLEEMEKAGYGEYLKPFIAAGLYQAATNNPEK